MPFDRGITGATEPDSSTEHSGAATRWRHQQCSFSSTERWWDQRLHLPGPPPLQMPAPTGIGPSCTVGYKACAPSSQGASASPIVRALIALIDQRLTLHEAVRLSVCSWDLSSAVSSHFAEKSVLRIAPEDATFHAAAYAIRKMPAISTLHVQTSSRTTMAVDLDALRSSSSAAVMQLPLALPPEAALFAGAILARRLDARVRVSDGRCIVLAALHQSSCIRLRGERGKHGLTDSDITCLLGCMSLNPRLKEIDLCGNPGPTADCAVVLRAIRDALPSVIVRHHRRLDGLGGIIRAAVELPRHSSACSHAAVHGVPERPTWLMSHVSDNHAHESDYVLPYAHSARDLHRLELPIDIE